VSEHDLILAGDACVVLPEAFVADVMVVDPPYRKHVHDSASSQDQHTDGGVRHNDFGFGCMTPELMTWLCKMAARTRRWSIIYTDIESVALWKQELELAGATYIRTLPWVRWSMPQLSGDRPPQGFECLVVAHGSNRGKKHWNGAGNLTHLAHLALRGDGKHKTEKPLDQLLDLVSWFSDRDELVVDPCAGSGTCGVACKILGRNFIGCELSAEWWEKANARIHVCNANDLPGSLSSRDSERFLRWVNTSEKEKGDAVSRKENTERVRKRLADKKAFLSVVPNPANGSASEVVGEDGTGVGLEAAMTNEQAKAWAETYQQCLAEYPVHCGSANCKLRPSQTDELGTACGCGCRPCSRLSAHMRPPAPKTSAAERTMPLPFEDEHIAKKWRAAYERAVSELDSISLPAWATAEVDPRVLAPVTRVATEAEFRCPECINEPVRCSLCQDFYLAKTGPKDVPPKATSKRGKGRPPGAKNKAPPKEWKRAYAWVMTELAPSS